jgi:hypothetical protein
MITSGIKLYVGYAVAALVGAVVYGYTSGGNHVGPLTMGYKGSVGDHLGYGILVGLGMVCLLLAVAHAAFRDADATAAAQLLRLDAPPSPQRPVSPSLWPVLGALGAGVLVVGLAVSPVLFWVGMILLAATVVEWMMEAWADRATGDPAVNRELRDRIMLPIELPVLAFAGIAVLVLAVSRIFLATSKEAAVWVAAVVAGLVFVAGIVATQVKRVPRGLIGGVLVVGVLGTIVGGVVAAAAGPREFEEHHGHAEEEHDEATGGDEAGAEVTE